MTKYQNLKELLGFEVGEWHISHDKLVSYVYKIAELSDRIKIEKERGNL